MSTTAFQTDYFTFKPDEFTQKLSQACLDKPLGYWLIKLESKTWYIALFQNQIFFSGREPLSWDSFFEILERYIVRLRNKSIREQIVVLKQEVIHEQNRSLRVMINQLIIKGLLKYEEVIAAVKLQILTDFETYLFDYAGEAKFILDPQLVMSRPLPGFELPNLISEVEERRQEWQKLKKYIPSIEGVVELQEQALKNQDLTEFQKEQLRKIISQGTNIREIALNSGKDPLNLAKTLAGLSQKGIVKVKEPQITVNIPTIQVEYSAPKLFIVDDSPLMLKQFRSLVKNIGYDIESCSDGLIAVEKMIAYEPQLIFLDVNMPKISGFQLIKQIRMQPQLAALPIVVLTADKSFGNKFRAEWSKSHFLSKPLKVEEVPQFYENLKSILKELAPVKT